MADEVGNIEIQMSHREGNIELSGHKKLKRKVQSYSAKAVSAVLAGTMVLGGTGAAFAETTSTGTPAAAVTPQSAATAAGIFSDVKTAFWAEKHIYKLASQGIVVGNNGLFRPGDSVTQQEAVLMALRFMKLQGNVNTSTDVVLPADFIVTNYYKPYVVLAFQQGLLDKTVEMAADNLKTSWESARPAASGSQNYWSGHWVRVHLQQRQRVNRPVLPTIPRYLRISAAILTPQLIWAWPTDWTATASTRREQLPAPS